MPLNEVATGTIREPFTSNTTGRGQINRHRKNNRLPDKGRTSPDDLHRLDLDIDHIKLEGSPLHKHGKALGVDIRASVTDIILEQTMDGASTIEITVIDPHRRIVKSGLFKKEVEIKVPRIDERDLAYAMVQLKKTGNLYTYIFEDKAIHELRKHKKPIKAFRDQVTRAEFIVRMLKEVKGIKIPYHIPQLHKKQKVKGGGKLPPPKANSSGPANKGGFQPGAAITFKGAGAAPDQIENASRVLAEGVRRGAPFKVLVAAIMTITQESVAHNTPGGDRDSVGLFQQRPSMGWGTVAECMNPEHAAGKFYDQAIPANASNPGISENDLCQHVQRSGTPSAFGAWLGEAVNTVKNYAGGTAGGGSLTVTQFKRYAFQRGQNGKKEDSWTAIQRLAQEVNWRAFMSDGVFYYEDEVLLSKAKPAITLNESHPAVDHLEYDMDMGKSVSQCTIYCQSNRWGAPPGAVCALKDQDPFVNGRWLVATIRRSFFNAQAEVTLKKPAHPKPEPEPATTTKTVGGVGGIGGAAASGDAGVDKVYAEAVSIGDRHFGYSWGGGHNSAFSGPYDCSGYVSACLHAAGWLGSPEVSGALASWGQPGVGRLLTVWANNGHVFMEFNLPGKGIEHWGTGHTTPGGGAGHQSYIHSHAGFSPRHWPGT